MGCGVGIASRAIRDGVNDATSLVPLVDHAGLSLSWCRAPLSKVETDWPSLFYLVNVEQGSRQDRGPRGR